MILSLQHIMSYKTAFFLVIVSLFLGDLIIPVVSTIIYQVSSGIPGWTLYEFILFQGTLIIVVGLWHTFFADLLGETIGSIEAGEFDKILLRPFNALAFMTSNSFDPEGLAEILAGTLIVLFALIKMNLFTVFLLVYVLIIILATLFEYALTIIAAALAFTFVKTWRLFEFISIVEKFSRYPLEVYTMPLRFVLTFIIPAAIAAYYPASILLGKQALITTLWVAIPVLIFFTFSLWLWSVAIKKYSSAGG